MIQNAQEARTFADSIKEPEYVIVSPEMVAAGVWRLEELPYELLTNRNYVVEQVYMAMEYERRSAE